MKPWERLDTARAPDGTELTLSRRGDEFVIRAGGQVLMSSRQHGSEERLAEVGCAGLRQQPAPSVLVGGLGFGYTLRAALDRLPRDSAVVVAELVPAVVTWNRGPLAALAGQPLDDARVQVETGDVFRFLERDERRWHAILLDVDNGPAALTQAGNERLYRTRGIELVRARLEMKGLLVVWSAAPDARFQRRLEEQGFVVQLIDAAARGTAGGSRHWLYVARAA